jgi:NADH dehydrogenase
VASQQGTYLGKILSQLPSGGRFASTRSTSFAYKHLGSLAYIGNSDAVADFGQGITVRGGWGTMYLWRSIYWSEQVSLRTRTMLAMDWLRELVFGRDISRS